MKPKTEKNPNGVGRVTDTFPTDFKEKLIEYLQQRQDTVLKVKLPTIEGFAGFLGVTRMTLYNWETAHPEVGKAMETILLNQLERLIDEGLGGHYNATIVKLLLSHNHKIKDETVNEFKGEVTSKFDDQQLQRIAERIATRGRSNGDPSGEEKSN